MLFEQTVFLKQYIKTALFNEYKAMNLPDYLNKTYEF